MALSTPGMGKWVNKVHNSSQVSYVPILSDKSSCDTIEFGMGTKLLSDELFVVLPRIQAARYQKPLSNSILTKSNKFVIETALQ